MLLVSQPDFALRIASRYTTFVSGIPTPAEMTLLAPWQNPQEQAPRKTVYAAAVQDIYNITRCLQYNTVLNLHLHLRFLGRMLSGQVRDFSQASTQILRMLEKNIVLQKTSNRIILNKTETSRVTQPLAALRRAAAAPAGDTGLLVQKLFAATPGAAAVFFPGDAEIVQLAQHIFSKGAIGETAITGGFRPGGLHGADIIFSTARAGDMPPRGIPGTEEPGGAVRPGVLPFEIAHAAQPGRLQIPSAQRDPSARGAEKSTASGETKSRGRAAGPGEQVSLPVLPPAPYRAWDTLAVPLGMGRADLPYTQMLGARPAVMVYREQQEGSPGRQPAQDAFLPGSGSFVRVSPLRGISASSGAFLPIAGERMPRGGISAADAPFAARAAMPKAPARNIPEGSPAAYPSAQSRPVFSGPQAPAFMQPLLPTRAMAALPQAERPAATRHALPLAEASAELPQRERQALLPGNNTARAPQWLEPAFQAGTLASIPAMELRNRQLTEAPPSRAAATEQDTAEARYRGEKKEFAPDSRAATPRTLPTAPRGEEPLPPRAQPFRPAARVMPHQSASAPQGSAPRNPPSLNEAATRGRAAVLPGRKTQLPAPEAAATYLVNSRMEAGKQIFARYAATAAIPSNPAMVYAKTPGRGRAEARPGADNGADIEFIRAEKKPTRNTVQAETNRQEGTRGVTHTVSAGVGAPLSAMPSPAELEKPLNEIADKVYRLLERRLRSEQMRKGLL